MPNTLSELDWDRYQSIRFRPEQGLWAGSKVGFQVRFFHLGLNFTTPVQMYEVVSAQARPIRYSPGMFDFQESGVNPRSFHGDLGFAGFRVHFHTDWDEDVVAFLGASYFRAVGGERQYGLSARGLAIDTGLERPEEFPGLRVVLAGTSRWATSSAHGVCVDGLAEHRRRLSLRHHARLDADVMDVDAALYPRRAIERLGIAPLTSMFLYGENDHRVANDWRPEIHDSDGLAIWNGAGECMWRPLVNPAGVRVNSYVDEDPRGFGLLQRDRKFDHYQDDGAYYNRRPSAWIEPKVSGHRRWGRAPSSSWRSRQRRRRPITSSRSGVPATGRGRVRSCWLLIASIGVPAQRSSQP